MKIQDLPTFSIANESVLQEYIDKNPGGYGEFVIRYAARWANLMEAKMSAGAELEDIAEETSHEADEDGISGNMYAGAVETLVECWEHGKRLLAWHNSSWLDEEHARAWTDAGKAMNPAIISMRIPGE